VPADAIDILRRHGSATDAYLRDALAGFAAGAPTRLIEAIEYSLFAGGKRLRPALVLETFAAVSAPQPHIPTPSRSALAAAGAIELIHTFSLVHDDLPAMDDDDLRRGRATNHKVFGEAMAILAGDAMMTLAFELIAGDADPAVAARLVAELSRAAGVRGMIGGQVQDMAAEKTPLSLDELKNVHGMKTGALIVAACRTGAIAAGATDEQLAAVTAYASHLGLGFQIVDDILDQTGTPQQLGKATQKDASRGKNTYPALLGLQGARDAARLHIDNAITSVQGFGQHADGLRAFARFVVGREN
jgi:geranylgeranyl diphosphate synthase, type II